MDVRERRKTLDRLFRAIRAHCVSCCGGDGSEVARCEIDECDLYPWRFGRYLVCGVRSPEEREAIYLQRKRRKKKAPLSAAEVGVGAGYDPWGRKKRDRELVLHAAA
jgi:hypothetical protein